MIELKHVTKVLKKNTVLDDVSYTFENGRVYGLYGENGSGKTMLLRALGGLIVPTAGEVISDGKRLHKDISFPDNTGIVIEHMELLPKFSARENLQLLAKIRKTATAEDITQTLLRVGLEPESKKKVKKYSLGMKQRLNIAQAIFEKQNVILLDEPTNALDADGVNLIYQIIEEEKRRGALIVMATHHKEDLKKVCNQVIRISRGSIVEEG